MALEQCDSASVACITSHALQDNYGKPDSDSVQSIKAVYNELGLEQRFFDYEQVK